jgi:UDP-glucose 4-epimerase
LAFDILIVGSNSILSKALLQQWANIHKLTIGYSSEPPLYADVNKSVDFISNKHLLSKEHNPKFDIVVLISALIPIGEEDTRNLFEVNTSLTLEFVKKYSMSKIIFCSTISVNSPMVVVTEESMLSPQSQYAISKLWAEILVKKNAPNHVILRISSLVGKGMKTNTFIPKVIECAKKEKRIVLYGDGKRKQNYIHVRDLATIIDNLTNKNFVGTLLCADINSYSNQEIAEKVQLVLPDTQIIFNGIDESRGYICNASRTYKIIEHVPKLNLHQVILELL